MLSGWKKSFYLKQKYSRGGRKLFFDLAGEYLPADRQAVILDIGAGNCEFAEQLKLTDNYENFHPLDVNTDTIKKLDPKYKAIAYQAPQRLPFPDLSVSYIHCSHLIEHLEPKNLYQFLIEIDRVLKARGRLVISTPMLWDRFYDDLSHVRPYNPEVLIHYLGTDSPNRSAGQVSNKFKVLNLAYRYKVQPLLAKLSSRYLVVDLLINIVRTIMVKVGFVNFIKNGYTIVLEKQA